MSQKQSLQAMRLQEQNRRLQKIIDQYMQEIQHHKHINAQHEKQIQSLLKFNQRLLSIIQDQVNNNQAGMQEKSLQPISQVTENDSETMEHMMQSLQKTRRKLAARSQKGGGPYLSTHQNRTSTTFQNNKVYQYMNQVKDLERSERYVGAQRDLSQFGNKSSFSKKRDKKGVGQKMDYSMKNELDLEGELQRVVTQTKPFEMIDALGSSFIQQKKKQDEEITKMKQKMATSISQQLEQARKNKELNCHMLDDKINRLNKLAKEMSFNPEQKFTELQSKIKLSPQIAALVKKAMVKK